MGTSRTVMLAIIVTIFAVGAFWYGVLPAVWKPITVADKNQDECPEGKGQLSDKQGRSGLGLDAQRKAVADHLDGGNWTLVAEFTEFESAKRNDRPELEKALAACKKHRARLGDRQAKIDFSRNLAFIATLMDRKVDFACCDNPHATKFNIHILAAVAELERDMILKRTRKRSPPRKLSAKRSATINGSVKPSSQAACHQPTRGSPAACHDRTGQPSNARCC